MNLSNCAIATYFNEIKDPPFDRKKRHNLLDIILLSVCGVMCGADGWEEIDAAENFSVLRRIALNLFKREPSKRSIKRKRLLACLNFEFMITALNAGL